MKIFRFLGQDKVGLILPLVALMAVLMTTPFGLNKTAQSDDGFSGIASALDTTDNPKIAYLYSWNDRPRNPNFDFVTKSAESLLNVASFGEKHFINYLAQNGYTHILVPEHSAKRREIFHKWGSKGTINISLTAPNFTRVASTGGGNDVVLFKINTAQVGYVNDHIIPYDIEWLDSVRPTFHQPIATFVEKGFHRYDYLVSYEDGPSVSWVFQPSGFRPEVPAFKIRSAEMSSRFKVAIRLVASYGPNAPPQVIRVNVSGKDIHVVKLLAGSGRELTAEVKPDEVVTINSVLPCNQPRVFEPTDSDERRFCFGISDLRITPIQS